MIQGIFVYICLLHLLHNSCFAASVKNYDTGDVDSKNIRLSFYDCNSTNVIRCFIGDFNCIENTYKRLNKDNYKVTLFVHGYLVSIEKSPIPYLISAYCSKKFSLLILLDWTQQVSAGGDIIKVNHQVPMVGKIVASTFNTLKNTGYNVEAWHLIGHSMGAHVVGCIGTYINFRLLHATGLDPAGILFYTDMYKGCQMEPNVADLTDAFYTDSLGYAAVKSAGVINIYANTGTSCQPGCCSSDYGVHVCSHIKAMTWYADAVRNETKFLATKCDNCFAFLHYDICKENDRIYLGPRVNRKASGNYCIRID